MPDLDSVLVRPEPAASPIDDPYYLCAVLLIVALDRLSAAEPGLRLPSMEPLKAGLLELKTDIDASATGSGD